jgi:hypothetical protein
MATSLLSARLAVDSALVASVAEAALQAAPERREGNLIAELRDCGIAEFCDLTI